jgi:hypothetical protein
MTEVERGWFRRRIAGEKIRMSVRWVYLHMIEEYARHNGHADLLRERIDGATGSLYLSVLVHEVHSQGIRHADSN